MATTTLRQLPARPLSTLLVLLLAATLPSAVRAQVRLPATEEAALEAYGRMDRRLDGLLRERRYRDALALGDSLLRFRTAMIQREGGDSGTDVQLATLQQQLAGVQAELGNLAAADTLYRRSLATFERVGGPDDAHALSMGYATMVGALEKGMPLADSLYPELLARAERIHGRDSFWTQMIRDAFRVSGPREQVFSDLVDAGQLDAALALGDSLIRAARRGGHDAAEAEMLTSVASIHERRGNREAADTLYARAIAIHKSRGETVFADALTATRAQLRPSNATPPARVGTSRRTVAAGGAARSTTPKEVIDLLLRAGEMQAQDPAGADSLYREAVALFRRLPPSKSIEMGQVNIMLGMQAAMRGDEGLADSLLVRTGAFPDRAALQAVIMPSRIGLARQRGNHAEADSLIRVQERLQPPKGMGAGSELLLAYSLHDQAIQAETEGRFEEGLRIRERTADLLERERRRVLTPGEEEAMEGMPSPVDYLLHGTVALNARRPDETELTALGLTLVLRYKGRELDLSSDLQTRRRRDARSAGLLDSLAASRAALSALASRGPVGGDKVSHRAAMARAFATHFRLASAIRVESGSGAPAPPAVSLAQVRAALPEDAVLVELVAYESAPRTNSGVPGPGAPRYGAYVLARVGAPRFVDLGGAPGIDSLVVRFHSALSGRDPAGAGVVARRMEDVLLRPLRPYLGSAQHLLISPDGMLNRVPFAALRGEDGTYLVERLLITYLTSGRDLLRLRAPRAAAGPPLVVANPDYGRAAPAGSDDRRDRGGDFAVDLSAMSWRPLPGTAGESAVLAQVFPNAQVKREGQATESLVKRSASPFILHVATHGFFLGDTPLEEGEVTRAWEDAALLSAGLALAGANDRDGGDGEDGILTALEVSGLDLAGTELVVLSACETGIGQVSNGRGVYGLRRSLVLAGARSQLTTLWRVDDDATHDMMSEYYERLRRGEARSEALRAVQLGMLRPGERSDPYFWAAFIPLGDWTPLPADTPGGAGAP